MKVKFLNKEFYHKSGVYKELKPCERKFYLFLNCYDDVKTDTWYLCYLEGFRFDGNSEKIVGMDIDIKTEPESTYCIRIRIDMADISNKFVQFDDFYNLCDDSLVVKIANLQNGSRKEDYPDEDELEETKEASDIDEKA